MNVVRREALLTMDSRSSDGEQTRGSSSAWRALVVAYLLYMMIRRRKGERPGYDGPRARTLIDGPGDGELAMNFGKLGFSMSLPVAVRHAAGRRGVGGARGRPGRRSSRSTSSSSAAGRSRCRARCSGGGAWRTCTSTACSSGCGGTCCCSSSSWPSSWRCWRWPGRGSQGTTGQGQRFVLAIDNSASMSATDVAPSRLARAKEEARKIVERDGRATTWRWSSPSPTAPRSSRTTPATAALLLQRIDAIAPTEGTDLAPRGAPGRGRAGQSLEADRRGGRRLVGRHAQADDLHRRRVPRRRGLQPGQPRARGGRDRPAAASPAPAPAGDDAKPSDRAQGQGPVRQRGDPRLADPAERREARHSTRSSAGSTTSAPRRSPPRPSSTGTTPTSPARPGTLIDAIALKIPPRATSRSSSTCPTPA